MCHIALFFFVRNVFSFFKGKSNEPADIKGNLYSKESVLVFQLDPIRHYSFQYDVTCSSTFHFESPL